MHSGEKEIKGQTERERKKDRYSDKRLWERMRKYQIKSTLLKEWIYITVQIGWVKFSEWKKQVLVVAKYVEDPKLTIF